MCFALKNQESISHSSDTPSFPNNFICKIPIYLFSKYISASVKKSKIVFRSNTYQNLRIRISFRRIDGAYCGRP